MTRPFNPSEAILVPMVLVISVFPQLRLENIAGATKLYHSFLVNGSIAFLRPPFLDFVKRLFFPCNHETERLMSILLYKSRYKPPS